MFVLLLKYTKAIEEVQKHTEAHRDYLDQFYQAGTLIVSGRRIDQTGGIVLANMASLAEVEQFIAADPYKTAGVVEYEAIDFHPSKWAQEFGPFLHNLPKGDITPTAGTAGDVVPRAR